MRPALLAFALTACIGANDVQGALNDWCADPHACAADSECCTHYACLEGACVGITQGECLTLDGGSRATGQACGCNLDCAGRVCSSASTCN